MLASKLYSPTLRELPADAVVMSHKYMLKAGMMRKKYKVERMDTDAFLRQFGIDLSEMMEEFGL